MDNWSEASMQSVSKEEKRIVLLGSHSDVKVSCGNIILGQEVFSESKTSLQLFERHAGVVLNRRLIIINTPDLHDLTLFSEEQDIRRCFRLVYPGPHALLLVLKSGTFTDQERDALNLINFIFGAGASEFVIVIFMHEEQTEYVSVTDSTDADETAADSLLQICKWPQHHLKMTGDKSQVQKLLESIEKMVVENGGHYFTIPEEESKPTEKKETIDQSKKKLPLGPESSVLRRPHSQTICCTEKSLDEVRIVLIGKTGVGKSATGNTILGRDVFQSRARMISVTKRCQREEGVVCGRAVTVVDTPGLFDTTLTNEEIQQEIMRCIELSAPGPHVFLLVIAVGPFTQEERETLQLIQITFGQKAESYTIVLFTRGDNLEDESIEDYVQEGDPHVQKLISDCGERYHMINNKDKNPAQVVSLLKKIDKMLWSNNASFYDNKMFQEAERAFRLTQLNKEREAEIRQQMEAIKAKYEAEIKEIKGKLEEEKAKGKVRELLLMEKENMFWKSHLTLMMIKDDDEEQTQEQDQLESKASSEIKRDVDEEEMRKLKLEPSEKTDPDRETETSQRATAGEPEQTKKKHKIWKGLGSFKKEKRKTNKKRAKETATGEKEREEIKPIITDQKISKDSEFFKRDRPLMKTGDLTDMKKEEDNTNVAQISDEERGRNKNLLFHQQYKEMEECKQKMEEIKRRYKEIKDIHAAEQKKMKQTHADNIAEYERRHGKCVLQ